MFKVELVTEHSSQVVGVRFESRDSAFDWALEFTKVPEDHDWFLAIVDESTGDRWMVETDTEDAVPVLVRM